MKRSIKIAQEVPTIVAVEMSDFTTSKLLRLVSVHLSTMAGLRSTPESRQEQIVLASIFHL
jgi:hypothetical protein